MTGEPSPVLAPGRRRRRQLASAPQAEFSAVVMQELRRASAAAREAIGILSLGGGPVSDVRHAEAARLAELQTSKIEWLVRLVEAVDGRGAGRRVTGIDVGNVVRQALDGFGIRLVVEGQERGDGFTADPERVWLGLELLLGSLAAPNGTGLGAARFVPPGLLVLVARTIDLDDAGVRWRLRAAHRVLGSEGCELKVRTAPGGIRAEVRFG